jgi:hypothetical protein
MRLVVAVLLAFLTFSAGAALGTTQVTQVDKVSPKVLAGPDVGFRVEGLRGATPVGRIVVRVNDNWVEAELVAGAKLVTR